LERPYRQATAPRIETCRKITKELFRNGLDEEVDLPCTSETPSRIDERISHIGGLNSVGYLAAPVTLNRPSTRLSAVPIDFAGIGALIRGTAILAVGQPGVSPGC